MFEAPRKIDKGQIGGINDLLDISLKSERESEAPREYLGASIMGDNCARKIAYQWHGRRPDFSGRLYRIFDMGHFGEEYIANYFKMAGFTLQVFANGSQTKQIGFSDANGKIKGHCDGIFRSGPLDLPYPMLWECKTVNDNQWNQFRNKGVKEWKATYYGQAQLYMAHFGLKWCLFTAMNKNDCELWHELVPYVEADAQAISDRGFRIIQSKSPTEFPRCASRKEDFRCRYCDFKDECWSAETQAIQPQNQEPRIEGERPWLTLNQDSVSRNSKTESENSKGSFLL